MSLANAIRDALADPPSARIVVGYSGGLDSTVLLHALAQVEGIALRAIHVDHGLHPDSATWAAHCERSCEGWGIAFESARVEVAAAGKGIEAAAREARHAAFAQRLEEGETLALAHHRDDQVETVLLRLLRGAGTHGLAAMRPLRAFAPGWLWRPLLALPRATLEAHARAHGLDWIEDPANARLQHGRNRLRHEVLPLLERHWPGARAALARAARLAAEDARRLDALDAQLLAAVQGADPRTLDVAALVRLDEPVQRALLRAWVTVCVLPPPNAAAFDAFSGWLSQRADAAAVLRWPGAELRRYRSTIYAMAPLAPPVHGWQLQWDGATALRLPDGFGRLALEPAAAMARSVTVRPRAGGERIALPGREHTHALKHVLQELGVPPWTRRRLPLLVAADGELLAAADLVRSARWVRLERESGMRLRWHDGHD